MSLDSLRFTYVETLDEVLDMMTWLGNRRGFLAFDVETEGLNVGCDKIRLAQFGDHEHGWALDYHSWRGVVAEVFRRYDRPLVAHNALFDVKMLKADGITVPQRLAHDTMIMTFLENAAARMGLKPAAAKYVDRQALAGKGVLEQAMVAGGWNWATVPVDLPAYWHYAALDTCLTALLADALYPKIEAEYLEAYELELAVIHCLRDAELAGLLTDQDYIDRAETKLEQELLELTPQIPVGNPGSDRQIVEYLLGIGAPLFVKTEKGNLSVDKHVLAWLAPQFPVAEVISQWRQKERQLNAYLRKFRNVGDSHNGLAVGDVLRASTKPVGARTGRQSVTDPPLQTLPRGRVVRDAIIAREGHHLLQADFAGMEMRALASLAREETMLAAYNRGEDLHDFVADALYGASFTKQQRQVCKNAGFAKIFGAGVPKFAVTAGVSVDEATVFLQRYDGMFPGVAAFMQRVVNAVIERAGGDRRGWGWVTLQDGRRLPVEASKAYTGVSFRIQGGTAVAMKRKIVELDSVGLGPCFRLAVHDELLYEVPEEHCEEVRHVIERVMPDRTSFPGVTLEIETDEVERWGQHYRDDYEKFVDTADPEWLV